MASVFLVSGSRLRRPSLDGPARPRSRAAPPAPRPRRQWRAAAGLSRARQPGRAPSDLEVGTARCGPRGDGACPPSGLHRSPASPSHGAADWLGDMAGRLFALALCGTLLPGDRRLGTGVCDVMPGADQSEWLPRRGGPAPSPSLPRARERASTRRGGGGAPSRVARMSGEAPPLRLYIKRWRGARRRHFALEWSSL